MNAVAKTRGAIFKDQMVKMRPNLAAALPSHISVEKFERVALTAVQTNPDLLAADQQSLFLACQKAATDGLMPDGREGALVIFNTKIKEGGQERWLKKVQWMPMVAGLLKLARNSGEIASVNAHIVYKGEKFAVVLGDDERIEHDRDMDAVDNAEPVACYAVAKLKNGETVREVMTWKQVMKRRNVSKQKDGGIWSTWTEEMAKKTAIRSLSKRLPFDTDKENEARTRQAIERVDEDMVFDGEASEVQAPDDAPKSRLDALEGQIEQRDEPPHDTETGEIIQARAVDWLDALMGDVQHAKDIHELEFLVANAAIRSKLRKLQSDDPARSGAFDQAFAARKADFSA